MKVIQTVESKDRCTAKYVQETEGDLIETVVVDRPEKRIVCFSTQVGCPLSCSMCEVSQLKYVRNLTYEELIRQCLKFTTGRPTLFFAMGVGEPSLNPNLTSALMALSDHGRVAIATTGIKLRSIKAMSFALRDIPTFKIQLSVQAPTDDLRRQLLDPNLPSLESTLMGFRGLQHTVEYSYTLLNSVNDEDWHAEALAKILNGTQSRGVVKLNNYNTVSCASYVGSNEKQVKRFASILKYHDIKSEIYATGGSDIQATYGQLLLRRK